MAPRGYKRPFPGAENSVNRIGGQQLPFDIDAELEAKLGELKGGDSDLFPDFDLPLAAPPTAEEVASVDSYRSVRAGWRSNPLFMHEAPGKKGPDTDKTGFSPFEDAPTYGRELQKKSRAKKDLSTFPFVTELFPAELRHVIDPRGNGGARRKRRKMPLGAMTLQEKLAKIDEGADADGAKSGEDEGDDADDADDLDDLDADGDADNRGRDGEDRPDELQDDDFEDDEDDDDDYNAEQYFDGGEDDFDDAGGDDGHAGDEW